jgi:hypothetical protein
MIFVHTILIRLLESAMITKSDFMVYLDNPLHFWASKHNQLENDEPSAFARFLMEQGRAIEEPAKEYIVECMANQFSRYKFFWQPTYTDGEFQIRADAVIYDQDAGEYDLIEIKASTNIKPEHRYDMTFQALVFEANLPLRDSYLVYLNKEYVRQGEVDIKQLFIAEKLTSDVNELKEVVQHKRVEAVRIARLNSPDPLDGCLRPRECICPSLCHPNLPENPIFNIPRIGKKALDLKEKGILSIKDIPDDYPLSARQLQEVQMVKTDQPIIQHEAIREQLAALQFPLYFLDYETNNPSIPHFDGFHPFQHIVFQYSLHRIDTPDAELQHFEYLSTEPEHPEPRLLEPLSKQIKGSGTVVVWNKPFEIGRNKEMAERHPKYAEFLSDLNVRVFDLMTIFSRGLYLHPRFEGSASIKNVLSILVPSLCYASLNISEGSEAMLTWWRLVNEDIPAEEKDKTIQDLLQYCKLDTLAMVEIWKVLLAL